MFHHLAVVTNEVLDYKFLETMRRDINLEASVRSRDMSGALR